MNGRVDGENVGWRGATAWGRLDHQTQGVGGETQSRRTRLTKVGGTRGDSSVQKWTATVLKDGVHRGPLLVWHMKRLGVWGC